MSNAPIIVAHRGIHRVHPENSCAAFDEAIAAGFWVECDVHASRDGEPIVIHDETLERTTDACGRIDGMDAGALERIHLKGSDQTVPTFQRAVGGGGCWLVEIKPPRAPVLVRRVVDLLRRHATRWMVQSFDAPNVRELWVYDPTAAGAFLVEDSDVLERAISEGWPAIHVSHELLSEDVARRLRAGGASVSVWTVNELADIRRVVQLGVDMLITDEPDRARDLLTPSPSGRGLG